MKLKELQPRQGKVEITAEVIQKDAPRSFEKFGKSGSVCNAKIKDDSGEMKLTLWNEQIEQVNVGDKVKISNGYVNEFQGELQLTTGKFGKLEVLGKSDDDEGEHILTEDEKTEEELLYEHDKEPSIEESVTEDEASMAESKLGSSPYSKKSGNKVLTVDEQTEEKLLYESDIESDVEDDMSDDELEAAPLMDKASKGMIQKTEGKELQDEEDEINSEEAAYEHEKEEIEGDEPILTPKKKKYDEEELDIDEETIE